LSTSFFHPSEPKEAGFEGDKEAKFYQQLRFFVNTKVSMNAAHRRLGCFAKERHPTDRQTLLQAPNRAP
jgi:hypothetical protein